MGEQSKPLQRPIPITTFNGFLGAVSSIHSSIADRQGKTTTILGLLEQLPEDYKVSCSLCTGS